MRPEHLPMDYEVEAVAAAFWPLVRKTETCWLWDGHCVQGGYGGFRGGRLAAKHRIPTAHRAAWWLANLRPIPRGLCVCHHCDVKRCVRPKHLFLGTTADNINDYFAKVRRGLLPRPVQGLRVNHLKNGTTVIRENGRLLHIRLPVGSADEVPG